MYNTSFGFDSTQCDPVRVDAMIRLLPETVIVSYGAGSVTLVVRTVDVLAHGRTCRDIMMFAQRAGLELSNFSTGVSETPTVPTLVAVVLFNLAREVLLTRSDAEGALTVPSVEVLGRDLDEGLIAEELLRSVLALEADLTNHSLVSESLVLTAQGLRREVYYAIPLAKGTLAQIGRQGCASAVAMSSAQALAFCPLTLVGREALRLEEIFSQEETAETGAYGGPVGRAWLTIPYGIRDGVLLKSREFA